MNITSLENTKKVRKTLPHDKEEKLIEFTTRKREIVAESDAMSKEIQEIQDHLRELKVIGKISASGVVYAGVKVYEYTPGFIHSKVVISDDKVATVGSANFDYRSLYHHFECGTCIYDSKSIEPIYKDFMDIVEKSKLIEKTDLKYNVIKSLFQQILRVFAPLM